MLTDKDIQGNTIQKSHRLKVYYGWSKINAVRKKCSLSIMFENDASCQSERGQRLLSSTQETVIERYQDDEEMKEGKQQNKIYTGYDLFFNEKPINGSLDKLLQMNHEADKNHVSKAMRDRIAEALRKAFLLDHPDYKEPHSQQCLTFK